MGPGRLEAPNSLLCKGLSLSDALPLTSGLAHGAPFLQGLDSHAPVPWLTVLLSAASRDHVFLPSLSLSLAWQEMGCNQGLNSKTHLLT